VTAMDWLSKCASPGCLGSPDARGESDGEGEPEEAQREVRLIGICGASATGKTTVAAQLAELLHSPVLPISADWYFRRPRDFAACPKCANCWELTSSVDLDGLAQDLHVLSDALARASPGPVPELLFGHSAHGVWGISKRSPVGLARGSSILTHEPVYVVIDGFRLFGDPSVCDLLHAGIWLECGDDGELLARRRYQRGGGRFHGDSPRAKPEDEAAWREFREEYVDHIYAHHLRAAPGMLANARSILSGTITIAASTSVDGIVAEAHQLLLVHEKPRGVRGCKRAAVGSAIVSPSASISPALASMAPSAFDSPIAAPRTPLHTPPQQQQAEPPRTPPPPPAFADRSASTSAASSPSLAATPEAALAALPPGSRVAVLDFLGSFCPITKGHVACLVEARRILNGHAPPVNADGALVPYDACLGALCVNGESHVRSKLRRAGEAADALPVGARIELCKRATAFEHGAWIRVGTPADVWVASLRASFPLLSFSVWRLNGADDVVRYEKWEWASPESPFITMGRPGDTPAILTAIRTESLPSSAFVLGPDMPDVSSTAARNALRQADRATIEACLHPHVVAWFEQHGPYPGLRTA